MADVQGGIAASIEEKEVVLDDGARFSIRLPRERAAANAFMIIDIYDLDNPVHPEGHVGWWRYDISASPPRLTGVLLCGHDGRLAPEIDAAVPVDEWRNPEAPDVGRMELLVVLRSSITNAILSKDRVPVFLTAQGLGEFRSRTIRDPLKPRFRRSVHNLPADRTIHIVSKSMFERDAVGNLCFSLYKLLTQEGLQARLFADNFDLAMNDVVSQRGSLHDTVRTGDAVVYFFSTFDDKLEDVIALGCDCRVAYYHGITPPQLLQVFDPEVAAQSAKAIRQLPLLSRFDRLAANSQVSADELLAAFSRAGLPASGEIAVIRPKILSEAELQASAVGRTPKVSQQLNLLFVGRIKSHKRVEDVLALIAEFRRLDPEARGTIIGAADTTAYSDYLNWVQTRQLKLPEEAVNWRGEVEDDALARAYDEASVYVSMSEHEGFGLPILEAMMRDLPVFCFDSPSVRELLGASGTVFEEKSFPTLAIRLRNLISSPAVLDNQLKLQRQRVGQLIGNMDGSAFLRLLEGGAGPDASRRSLASSSGAT